MSRFPSRGSRDLWLSLETFPRGFLTGLSHEAFPQGCPDRGVSRSSARKSRQCRENRLPWNGLRHLGDSGNGDTTLEFLSPFLWRAPPLETRRERREFFPDHAGKGPLLSSQKRKRASSRLEGRTSWIFSSCGRCSQVTTGTSGTLSGGLRKGRPHASCSGASRYSSPVDAGE